MSEKKAKKALTMTNKKQSGVLYFFYAVVLFECSQYRVTQIKIRYFKWL